MSGLFYNLGRKVGPKIRKAKWVWQSITGSEADAIRMEYDVGKDLVREIRHQLKFEPEPKTRRILTEIGSCLSGRVANKLRKFTFEAIGVSEPNAFAVPGGFIFVSGSLLELCQWDEDEIAFIFGHEMGHVIRGHAMDRIISNSAIAVASRASPVRGVPAAWLRKVGVKFLESAYSQKLELEADELGVRLAVAAHYDPKAAVRLLSRLADLRRSDDQFSLGSYFCSHPAFSVRIRNIGRFLRQICG